MFLERWLGWKKTSKERRRRRNMYWRSYLHGSFDSLPQRSKRNGSELSLAVHQGPSKPNFPRIGRREEEKGLKMKRSEQQDCFLLSRLPFEIRMMIYREVLAGHRFHMVTKTEEEEVKRVKKKKTFHKRTRVSHIICPGCDCSCCFHDTTSSDRWETAKRPSDHCVCRKWWRKPGELGYERCGRGHNHKGNKSGGGLLSFLKTCQQVYSEAITILYSSNVFDFPAIYIICAFKAAIPPQRQADIRFIQIEYAFHISCTGYVSCNSTPIQHNDTPWRVVIAGGNSSCGKNNRSMPSLKEIRLVMPFYPYIIDYSGGYSIFQPMGDLLNVVAWANRHGPNETTVVIDYCIWLDRNQEKLAEVLRNAPFLKLRTPRFHDGYPELKSGETRYETTDT